MTVKGVVYSSGKGVAGVVVSDGYEVTVTDSKGYYYLSSVKKAGFVFISVPANYEVVNEGNAPQFFKRISPGTTTVEQKDFSLMKVNNEKHVVIPMADRHLASRNNDLEQFTNKVLPDVNATIEQYAADGTKVYVLTLGDMTWELYWYSNGFGLNEYIPYMNKLKAPVFNLMGNHDNDPYYANDWDAEEKYRDIIGPTYYSFNLGKIHYVVLDNVEYLNNGAAVGTVGDRSYRDKVNNDQIEWLKKDLAAITDKSTPVVLAMHTPLYANPSLGAGGTQVNKIDMTNGSVLIDCFKDFATVHVLTGHTHINHTVEEKTSLMEHNIAAICATWWWTGKNGYAGNHICRDGSPGGYGIWKMDGRTIQWLYKSIGYQEGYQFRAYDLNTAHITAAAFAPNSTDSALAEFAGPYATPRAGNEVMINIWGYDSQWKIDVTENGKKLTVNRVKVLDPLHIVSYEALRLNAGAAPTDAFVTTETAHMFSVTAGAPDTTLEINVTDRFGNVYSESMIRPKPFGFLMK
jgi:3',5'-cyclic AMP phosphodiesterase CpdA